MNFLRRQVRRNSNAQQQGVVLHIGKAGSLNSIRIYCPKPDQSGAYIPHHLILASTVKTWKNFVLVIKLLFHFSLQILTQHFFAELRGGGKEIALNSLQNSANFK
jgi:hypothetical protein